MLACKSCPHASCFTWCRQGGVSTVSMPPAWHCFTYKLRMCCLARGDKGLIETLVLQETDVEQGLSAPNLDRGAYSRARPADLPSVPERRHSDAAIKDDVMERSNTEEMMLGSGSGDEELPQAQPTRVPLQPARNLTLDCAICWMTTV